MFQPPWLCVITGLAELAYLLWSLSCPFWLWTSFSISFVLAFCPLIVAVLQINSHYVSDILCFGISAVLDRNQPWLCANLNSVHPFEHNSLPIQVAHQPKRQKQVHNVFCDNSGLLDQSDDFDHLLHNVDGCPILRKLLHPLLALNGPVDPLFLPNFDPAVHKTRMYEDLDLSHLPLDVQDQVYSLVCEFWSVFDGMGYTMPVLWRITSVLLTLVVLPHCGEENLVRR